MAARKKRLTKAALLRWLVANDACPKGMARIRKSLRTRTPAQAWARHTNGDDMAWVTDCFGFPPRGEIGDAWDRFIEDQSRWLRGAVGSYSAKVVRKHFPWPLVEAAILDDIARGDP